MLENELAEIIPLTIRLRKRILGSGQRHRFARNRDKVYIGSLIIFQSRPLM